MDREYGIARQGSGVVNQANAMTRKTDMSPTITTRHESLHAQIKCIFNGLF